MSDDYDETLLYRIGYVDIEYRNKPVCTIYLNNFTNDPYSKKRVMVSTSNFLRLCNEFEVRAGVDMHNMTARCYLKDGKIKYLGSVYRPDEESDLIFCKEF